MDTQLTLPSPSTISDYEKLGIVGILLLVIIVGLGVIIYAVRQFRVISKSALQFAEKQTEALTSVKDSVKEQIENSTRLHERIDTILTCPKAACPLLKLRQEQPDPPMIPNPIPA